MEVTNEEGQEIGKNGRKQAARPDHPSRPVRHALLDGAAPVGPTTDTFALTWFPTRGQTTAARMILESLSVPP
jgi:hypothetical protein